MNLCGGFIDYTRGMKTDYGQWRPGWSPAAAKEWWEKPLGPVELDQLRDTFVEAISDGSMLDVPGRARIGGIQKHLPSGRGRPRRRPLRPRSMRNHSDPDDGG